MSVDRHDSDSDAKLAEEGLSFLHQARGIRELDSVQVARIGARLHRPSARPRRILLWPVLAVLALTIAGGAMAARGGLAGLPLVGRLFAPKPNLGTRPPQQNRRAPSLVPRPTETPLPGEGAQPTMQDQPAARGRGAEDAIVAESRAFAGVIESWRGQHDATMALGLLDAYERRYPAGTMRPEARVLRAEIYLAQERPAAALSVLDAMVLSGIPRARELQTVRGELRVKTGRCREARADLGRVLKENQGDDLAKRARRALVHCP